MKITLQLSMTKELIDAFKRLPINRSAAISQAIMNASWNPNILVNAFHRRLAIPEMENKVRISYSRDASLDDVVANLSKITKLPEQHVIRLCMEAYMDMYDSENAALLTISIPGL